VFGNPWNVRFLSEAVSFLIVMTFLDVICRPETGNEARDGMFSGL